MESRRVLSTIVVNTLADESVANSTTSLREAIQMAAAGDTVQFRSGLNGVITLGGSELLIRKNLTIDGPGSDNIRVSGNGASRVFEVAAGANVRIGWISIVNGGNVSAGGGVLVNAGASLTLDSTSVTDNAAVGTNAFQAGAIGGPAAGGAIVNLGNLAVTHSVISRNTATGGFGELDPGTASGGAISNAAGATLSVSQTTLAENTATGGSDNENDGGYAFGGAIHSAGIATCSEALLRDNKAVGGAGGEDGGSALGGAVFTSGSLTFTASTCSANAAIGSSHAPGVQYHGGRALGGALYATNTAAVTVSGSTFAGNYASAGVGNDAIGGAILAAGPFAMTTSTVAGNTAKVGAAAGHAGGSARGGGIYLSAPAGTVGSITTSAILGNQAVGGNGGSGEFYGGGVTSGPGGAARGGALFAASGTLAVTNSTIANNAAFGGTGGTADNTAHTAGGAGGNASGGGADVIGTPTVGSINLGGGPIAVGAAQVTFTAATIAGNTARAGKGGPGAAALAAGPDGAGSGGGVNGAAGFANTLAATNSATIGPDVWGVARSRGFNLIGKADGTSGWLSSDKRGTVAAPLDPRLGPLGNYGGPTKVMPLLAGSPALDAGKAFGLATDQRGKPRPLDFAEIANAPGSDGSDIGAVEDQVFKGVSQTPFKGITVGAAPVTIQAEDFDNGGEGVAYHDVNAANLGGRYRNTGVDIQTTTDTGGGNNLGWTRPGEWLEYTLNVQTSGTYNVDFRVASNGSGGAFHLEVDGKNVTGPLAVPDTGGWQSWKTLTKPGVVLPARTHVLRLAMDSAGATGSVGNFNYLRFAPAAAPVTVTTNTASYVRDGTYATTNFGTNPVLEVKKNNTGYTRETYLKFDLSSASSVGSGKLRLYGGLVDAQNPSMTLAVYGAANTSWGESTLTWNNRPATGPQLAPRSPSPEPRQSGTRWT
jgi:CSLREA domain-containing protein